MGRRDRAASRERPAAGLALDGVPIHETQFDMRSGFPTVTRFDEETQTWHGTCCNDYRRRCRWSISQTDQKLALVEDPDV